jgi:hypothetical protein
VAVRERTLSHSKDAKLSSDPGCGDLRRFDHRSVR